MAASTAARATKKPAVPTLHCLELARQNGPAPSWNAPGFAVFAAPSQLVVDVQRFDKVVRRDPVPTGIGANIGCALRLLSAPTPCLERCFDNGVMRSSGTPITLLLLSKPSYSFR
eukprot:CAMPEP_0171603224 /NCGR_PEP_ID=MMETSP0990-20121206/5897_1 /TAXON_ID=483369 /ORGANISM="non described non described, Strain CCMP2098" /LENGTH=114 /DNA_ID=CAMNT_0012165543 /DNA_START=1482 /DNA_END=1822 /DNA_ORIENTATION=+